MSKDKDSFVTIKDTQKNVSNIAVVDQNNVSDMRITLDQLNVPDNIHFHNQTNEIIHTNLLQSTLNISRLETRVAKLEGQLKQKKVTNKACQVHVKSLESNIMVVRV